MTRSSLAYAEATSCSDSIQSELRAMGRGRTVLVIAHRLSIVVDADEIAVLEAGRIVERGSRDARLSRGDRYSRLGQRQAAEDAA